MTGAAAGASARRAGRRGGAGQVVRVLGSVQADSASGGFRATASGLLGAAREWLVEPAPGGVASHGRRPVIAVFGLAPRCGSTVVARSLAAALAVHDPAGAAVVWSATAAPARGMPARAATRLAGVIADVPGARPRAAGRLCIVDDVDPLALADTAGYHAPVVLDGGAALVGGAVAAVADRVLLVAVPRLEPALAAVVASRLARVGSQPLVVLNRAEGGAGRWTAADHTLPESRLAAQLVLGGREPRGAFGRAVRGLAEGCAS